MTSCSMMGSAPVCPPPLPPPPPPPLPPPAGGSHLRESEAHDELPSVRERGCSGGFLAMEGFGGGAGASNGGWGGRGGLGGCGGEVEAQKLQPLHLQSWQWAFEKEALQKPSQRSTSASSLSNGEQPTPRVQKPHALHLHIPQWIAWKPMEHQGSQRSSSLSPATLDWHLHPSQPRHLQSEQCCVAANLVSQNSSHADTSLSQTPMGASLLHEVPGLR